MLLVRYAIWLLAKAVLSCRYRIQVHGAGRLRDLKAPILILPNHPGYIDPVIVLTAVWPVLQPRPVLYEDYFRNSPLSPFVKILRAVLIPDLEHASAQARQRAEQALVNVIEALRQGDNVILWPAGHIERDGAERLGGARATADILHEVPEAQVVLVRTRGIWGSRLTFAYTGTRPPLIPTILKGFGLLLCNLLFFMPRRTVEIWIEPTDRKRMPEPKREALNPWLEAWFNAGGVQAPVFVPYHFFFGPRTREFPKPRGSAEIDSGQVPPETKLKLAEILAKRLGRPLTDAEQQAETTFDQLGLDSLDRMEVALAVEQQFGFHGDEVPSNLGQLWALAQGLIERAPLKPPPAAWFPSAAKDGPVEILGNTTLEAFVARALANRKDAAAADDVAGVLSYEQMLVGVITLARQFAALPAANVGLLLPASVACDVAFLALQMAGKLPVLLNWTTGPANLAHAVRLMNLTEVVTSKRFLDRFNVNVEGVRYLFLEELRARAGKLRPLLTLLGLRLLPNLVKARIPRPDASQPALILFTSGSERAPKAVPLTHANILSELRAGILFLNLTQRESVLGFLPAFHSFGIVVTSLFPLLAGLRVVHHPDPADAAGLARKIAAYRPTVLVGTPTFVDYITHRALPGELSSLHLIVVGAEKCPARLVEACARVAPQAELLEGYGVTECSPVVAGNRPGANRPGTVGQPIPGVEVCVVDLETEQEMPPNQLGMLWVHGPTVFPGYLGYDGPSPFRERNSKKWYVTGDLAEIDTDGFIHLAGRLKRFLKAGGEMISLPALEEPFARRYPPTDKGPRVAVEGIEIDRGCRIALFTSEPIDLAQANAILQQEGFQGVMRFDEVRRLDEIPVLGTGKVDYKVLRARLEAEKAKVSVP
jgi:acyl-CoA synthetase (AMP-forming)/AMP-acid ligase II/1-acyl-sn-glycerol-3-phosphate acyltransferase/acyl carrier protein